LGVEVWVVLEAPLDGSVSVLPGEASRRVVHPRRVLVAIVRDLLALRLAPRRHRPPQVALLLHIALTSQRRQRAVSGFGLYSWLRRPETRVVTRSSACLISSSPTGTDRRRALARS